MKNVYKNLNIFRCVHDSHQGFRNNISVYHILKEKKCFPDGCFYFKWKCKELSRKNRCHRGFKHVGRKCANCKFYYEEKIHNYPEVQINAEAYADFLTELEVFEEWLAENQNRFLEFSGKVDSIKPHFTKKIYPKAQHLSFRGYLVLFKDIFIGRTFLEDYVYLSLSQKYYSQLNIGRNAKLEGFAKIELDKGRIKLVRPKGIEIIESGEAPVWTEEKVILAREMATRFETQPEGCVQCPFGALVDVEYLKDNHSYAKRELLCLQGMKNHKNCFKKTEVCDYDLDK